MSYKSQLFPLSSTRETPLRQRISQAWGSSPSNLQDMKFLRSWFVYDSELESSRTHGQVNWNTVLGLVLAIAVSAGFWTGVGLLIAHAWR
jgi:hypothetical protein